MQVWDSNPLLHDFNYPNYDNQKRNIYPYNLLHALMLVSQTIYNANNSDSTNKI